jgi:deoxycytidylate deaminase
METKNKQIKRPYLPKGANVFYVDIDNKFMAHAKDIARLSNEKQQPVGAVIVFDNQIITSACNSNPLTSSFLINLHKKYCIRHMLKLPTGKYYWVCPGCAKKKDHAEGKASKKLLEQNIPGRPIDLYMWGHWACCDVCCSSMEKIPVNNIYLLKDCGILFDLKEPNNIIGKQF